MAGRGAALVTGGARRIGRVLAATAAQAGYDVAIHVRAEGDDHAEGISTLGDDRVLVVYDCPARARLTDDGTVIADVLLLPR